MSPELLQQIKVFQASSGFPLKDCVELVSEKGSAAAADAYRTEVITHGVRTGRKIGIVLNSVARAEPRLWDVFTNRRSSGSLQASTYQELQRWGDARAEFEAQVERHLNPKVATLADLREMEKWQCNGVDQRDRVEDWLWDAGRHCHLFPRYRADHLRVIRDDPFADLRPLQEVDVATKTIALTARFCASDVDINRGRYLASCIHQAEQYFRAAAAVDLTVRPLLMYYGISCLCRSALVVRISNFIGTHGSHGLTETTSAGPIQSLADYSVAPQGNGLYQALQDGMGSTEPMPTNGPWSLLRLISLVPELGDVLDQIAIIARPTQRVVLWSEHTMRPMTHIGHAMVRLVVPRKFLLRSGVTVPQKEHFSPQEERDIASQVIAAFPDFGFHLKYAEKPVLDAAPSASLQDWIVAVGFSADGLDKQRRLLPLALRAGTDGYWHVTYNSGEPSPHELLIYYAIFYGLSMLVRYKPVAWSNILNRGDGTRTLIEALTRVAAIKMPALTWEAITNESVLAVFESAS